MAAGIEHISVTHQVVGLGQTIHLYEQLSLHSPAALVLTTATLAPAALQT